MAPGKSSRADRSMLRIAGDSLPVVTPACANYVCRTIPLAVAGCLVPQRAGITEKHDSRSRRQPCPPREQPCSPKG